MVQSVRVGVWDPRRTRLPGPGGFRVGARVSNFGDLLGPLVLRGLAHHDAVRQVPLGRRSYRIATRRRPLVLSVGSIIHYALGGDSVWGSGVNAKVSLTASRLSQVFFAAVRGPLTAGVLAENGVSPPTVFGDPGLLVADVYPPLRAWAADKRFDVSFVPNLHDLHRRDSVRAGINVVDPTQPLATVLRSIAQSRTVIGSSLHGVVVAESLGIGAQFVAPGAEPDFKYRDYLLGTGRDAWQPLPSANAYAAGVDLLPPPVLDKDALVGALRSIPGLRGV